MTDPTARDLIQRLADSVELLLLMRNGLTPLVITEAALDEARAYLAQPEPEVPTDENWDALVDRLWGKYETIGYQGERFMYEGDFSTALDLVRQEIARWGNPAPAPPADGEVAELVAMLQSQAIHCTCDQLTSGDLRRAAELLQRQVAWQPIDTAPRDGTEILASDYDAIEIVSWVKPRFDMGIAGEWCNREEQTMFPAWWQPLPDHPELPEVGE